LMVVACPNGAAKSKKAAQHAAARNVFDRMRVMTPLP